MSPEPVLWPCEEHTKAKHELLRAFFNKWVSIHSSYFASQTTGGLVRIYDGFAGPGVYAGGEPGSPLIIMRALCTNSNLLGRWEPVRYDVHFVEKNQARAAMLRSKLTEFESAMRERGPGWTDRLQWTVTCGRYEENVPQPVSEPSALFLFLDPFGYSHAPMTLTQNLVQQPKSDTLIFLPLSFVNRFKDREGQEVASIVSSALRLGATSLMEHIGQRAFWRCSSPSWRRRGSTSSGPSSSVPIRRTRISGSLGIDVVRVMVRFRAAGEG